MYTGSGDEIRRDRTCSRNLIPGEQSLDEDEFVDVKAYELDELKQMIFEGKIQDSKTMAAILAYESKYLHG